MGRFLTELLGAMALALTYGLAGASSSPLAPIAVGLTWASMVYMGRGVSGGHYNPAVSLAALVVGRMPPRDFLPYVAVQLLGALGGAGLAWAMAGRAFVPSVGPGASAGQVLLAEGVWTFVVTLAYLHTALSGTTAGHAASGIAVGAAAAAASIVAGPISGAVLNPAAALGLGLTGAFSGAAIGPVWLYLAAPLMGGALAAVAYLVQTGGTYTTPGLPNPRVESSSTSTQSRPTPSNGG